MPVPKGYEKFYGRVVGHMVNSGKSLEEAKNIADRAVASREKEHKGPPKMSSEKKGK